MAPRAADWTGLGDFRFLIGQSQLFLRFEICLPEGFMTSDTALVKGVFEIADGKLLEFFIRTFRRFSEIVAGGGRAVLNRVLVIPGVMAGFAVEIEMAGMRKIDRTLFGRCRFRGVHPKGFHRDADVLGGSNLRKGPTESKDQNDDPNAEKTQVTHPHPLSKKFKIEIVRFFKQLCDGGKQRFLFSKFPFFVNIS